MDIFAGGTGVAEFKAICPEDPSVEISTTATVTAMPIVLAADALYAIPLQGSTAVGEPVRIVVATGVPLSPFQYLNGCRVTAPTGFTYEPASFNVGVPGGATGAADGFWTAMNPGGGFLLAPDNFHQLVSIAPGLDAYSFNVTPLGGSDRTTDSGALFNFEASFSTARTYTLGFQGSSGVISRTYYSDGSATEYFWGDITNNHAGVPNSINVE